MLRLAQAQVTLSVCHKKYRIELLPTEWKPETILAFKCFIVVSFHRLA